MRVQIRLTKRDLEDLLLTWTKIKHAADDLDLQFHWEGLLEAPDNVVVTIDAREDDSCI